MPKSEVRKAVDKMVNCSTKDPFVEGVAHVREGTLVGLEFFGSDLTPQEHRLRCFFHDDGTIEVVVVHGAKCTDTGEPTEVFSLTPDQVDHFLKMAAPFNRVDSAMEDVQEAITKGKTSAEELTLTVMASIMGVSYQDLLNLWRRSRIG